MNNDKSQVDAFVKATVEKGLGRDVVSNAILHAAFTSHCAAECAFGEFQLTFLTAIGHLFFAFLLKTYLLGKGTVDKAQKEDNQ